MHTHNNTTGWFFFFAFNTAVLFLRKVQSFDLTWPIRFFLLPSTMSPLPRRGFSHERKTCFQAQLTCMEMEEGALVGPYQAPEGSRGGERCLGRP